MLFNEWRLAQAGVIEGMLVKSPENRPHPNIMVRVAGRQDSTSIAIKDDDLKTWQKTFPDLFAEQKKPDSKPKKKTRAKK